MLGIPTKRDDKCEVPCKNFVDIVVGQSMKDTEEKDRLAGIEQPANIPRSVAQPLERGEGKEGKGKEGEGKEGEGKEASAGTVTATNVAKGFFGPVTAPITSAITDTLEKAKKAKEAVTTAAQNPTQAVSKAVSEGVSKAVSEGVSEALTSSIKGGRVLHSRQKQQIIA